MYLGSDFHDVGKRVFVECVLGPLRVNGVPSQGGGWIILIVVDSPANTLAWSNKMFCAKFFHSSWCHAANYKICSPHEKIIVLGTLMFGCSSFPCPSRTVTLTRTGLVCVCACDLLRETFRCLPPPCLGPVTGPMHHMHPQNNDSRAEVLQSQVPTKCSDPRRKTYTHCSGAGPSGQCPPRRTCRQVAWACLNSMPPVRLG